MRHLDDGTLRRLLDEPLSTTALQRLHLDGCEECRRRSTAIAADARIAGSALSGPAPVGDRDRALAALHHRIQSERAVAPAPWRTRWTGAMEREGRRLVKPLGGLAAALALVTALALTPAGSLAQTFITIFQPKQVAVVPVTSDELKTLPNLQKYGTVHAPQNVQPQPVTDAAAASQASGMTVLIPGTLPASVPANPTYQVMPSTTGSFTFSAAKARKAAAAQRKRLRSMPANINGSTLVVKTGNGVMAIYGAKQQIPALAIGQMQAPTVTSTGVSVKQLEDYVLSLPGVSPQLAASIRAIGDPTSTLPIPIPVDKAHSENVTVQGVQGVAVGDATGLGSAVIWEKDGIIYGVAGPLAESQVIDIANSLH